jgi:hypothetical protein
MIEDNRLGKSRKDNIKTSQESEQGSGFLKAIFTDVAKMPYSVIKSIYEGDIKMGRSKAGARGSASVFGFMLATLSYGGIAASGVGFGILLPYAASVLPALLMASVSESEKERLWPKFTEYQKTLLKDDSPTLEHK